jgi:hypothetical protein
VTIRFSKVLTLISSSALCNTAAAHVYQLEYSRILIKICSPFKVVTVDSLLSSATQDVALHNVIIRSYTSALCSILNEIHRLKFTWILIGKKPLRHWWTEQVRLKQPVDKWYFGDSFAGLELFLDFITDCSQISC